MIAHVAEASERSGRVVLWLDPANAVSAAAIDASARVAAAYGSEVETVIVRTGDLACTQDLPVRRLISARGSIAATAAEDALSFSARRQEREAERAALRCGISWRHTTVEGDAFDRLAEMCQARGPWNIVGLTHTPSAGLGPIVSSVLANVSGATGVIAAPSRVEASRTRVCVVIEDMDRMPSMLRAAERLRRSTGDVRVLIAEQTRSAYDELETAVRLLTEGRPGIVFEAAQPTFGVEGALDAALRRAAPAFVIARFGGALLPSNRALARTIALTAAPFLLVR